MTTKEKILTQSFQLFLNQGYKEVSVNMIINTCKISKGAFYHHFESKDDLYNHVLNRFFFNYFKSTDFVYDNSFSFKEKLNQFIISFITPYEELLNLTTRNDLLPYFRFLFQAAGHHETVKYRVNKHFYKKGYYLAMLITQEQEKNHLNKNINAKLIAKQLLSIILGITILDGIYDASMIKGKLIESIELYTEQILHINNTKKNQTEVQYA